MATQLVLLDTSPSTWKLDQRTREIGRRGLADARAALLRAGGPGAAADQGRRQHGQAA